MDPILIHSNKMPLPKAWQEIDRIEEIGRSIEATISTLHTLGNEEFKKLVYDHYDWMHFLSWNTAVRLELDFRLLMRELPEK